MDHSVHLSEDLCDVLTDSRNGGDSSNEAHKRNSIDGNNKQTSEFDAFIYKSFEGIQDQEFCNVF
jgi:tRNA pseudouridine synthase 10